MASKQSKPNLKTARDWHVHYVYNDPEFVKVTRMLQMLAKRSTSTPEQIELHRQSIAGYFQISLADLNLFMLPLYLENEKKNTSLQFDPASSRFSITFPPYVSRAELLDEWSHFEHFRETLFSLAIPHNKRKPPENPGLIYAITRCRRKHMTFPHIFELYRTAQLPNYKGSSTQFTDALSLERYYDKYKPDL